MPHDDLETTSRSGIGPAFDAWTPRLFKALGVVGVAVSIVQALVGEFNPVLWGGSLAAGSGGFVGDALVALKSGKE